MKNILKIAIITILPLLTFCSKNSNWTIVKDVQKGVYISGTATIYSGEAPASALKMVPLDDPNVKELPELVGLYTWLKADGEFNISMAAEVNELARYGNGGEVKKDATMASYTLEENSPAFKVEKDGFYYVVVNSETKEVNILPVNYGIIGAATEKGWGGESAFEAPVYDGNLTITWTGKAKMSPGEYKFRYSGDWGKVLNIAGGKSAKIFTDLGFLGSAVSPLVENSMNQVKPGGVNLSTAVGGEFQFTIKFDLRSRVFTATYKLIGEAIVPPKYPEKLFMVGDATHYGWDEPGTHALAEFHKIAGGGKNEGIYWKIAFIEKGKGFKVSNAKWSQPNIGFGEVAEFDAKGVTVSDNGGNMSVAESAIYTVVVDLRNNSQKLSVEKAKVYGIGDTFGGWDEKADKMLFSTDLDSKSMISPKLEKDGNLRMYVSHHWIPAWWNAEFNLFGTDIVYRNDGGDQAAVAAKAGQQITLHFDESKGSIK